MSDSAASQGVRSLERAYSKELSEFLARKLGLDPQSLAGHSVWAGSGNSIGAIALRLGVLSVDQVEQVVDLQAADGELFGELASALGFLAADQIEELLTLQRIHRCLDQAAPLALEDRAGFADLLRLLAEFVELRASSS